MNIHQLTEVVEQLVEINGCTGFKCRDCSNSDAAARKVTCCPTEEALATLRALRGPMPSNSEGEP